MKQRKTRLEFFFSLSLELQVVSPDFEELLTFKVFFFFFPFEQVFPFGYISRVESDGGGSNHKPALRNQ